MNRPTTLSIKSFLIRKLAVDIIVPEKIIEQVVDHQFNSIMNALSTRKETVEISGFGTFKFNEKKAIKRMTKFLSQKALYSSYLEDETITPTKRRNISMRLNTTLNNIEALKKLTENEN